MTHYLYIIYSISIDKYYIGETNNLDERLIKHNKHLYKKSFTKIASDWNYVLTKECLQRNDAIYLEKFIKRMKSKKFIEKIILKPNILEDILDKKLPE
ncbi:GIY-YIG nuclease family protein [Aureibaculum algae]|uniref:GIY-YIG nuclease family protein n=1 Tax=Aureibaculum algae TaxID=2584122 RepID=A0A5B7TV49_9FLAO|nr:GIY-YIG nuclease family protein [Aureibaculum algae]QCX40757.1 GIY-YIG nuclease family protein [Aureibaculum algae]QCX40758.1 GIY-YIG nuclease family protein [Aureibaculum algae]QCX40759.1 GIY-YIG nuclease family protein [Aureibaculum algae]